MSNSDQKKPGGKSGQRKKKRSQKRDQAQSPMPDQQQAAKELVDAAVAATDSASAVAVAPADTIPVAPVPDVETPPVAEVASADTPPVSVATPAPANTPPVSADTPAVGLQTIATAYRDCTRKSLEEARSYVEKLSGVRTLDKAVEVQTEFAKQAYETFVADSWKIRGLYSELFKQMLKLPGGPSR
jgi:Phasin protein